jgi:ABC-2 type transport system ATP-binding protein
MSEAPPILVEALRKVFRRGLRRRPFAALDGVSFAVQRGEVVGYIGRNGAGKTTTFKALLGLLYPTAGRVTLLGRAPDEPGARRAVGFLPETPHFYEYLTGREGLEFYGRLHGLSRADARAAAPPLLERVGLRDAADVALREYSKGMRQRFGVAQALVGEPQIVVLDEPLEGLDPLGRRALKDLIRGLRDAGRSVLFSTHVLADVEDVCDRALVIEAGRLRAEGTLAQLLGTRATGYDLTVAGVSAAALTALAPGATLLAAATADAPAVLRLPGDADPDAAARAVHAAGGTLRALVPHRESLEELFVRLAGGDGAA